MEISTENLEGISLIVVAGRVDNVTAPDFETALKDLAAAARIRIVLDLAEVEYISSAGLRSIASILKLVKRSGGDLRLASPSPRVEEVLRLAGFTSLLSIYASRAEAVASYA